MEKNRHLLQLEVTRECFSLMFSSMVHCSRKHVWNEVWHEGMLQGPGLYTLGFIKDDYIIRRLGAVKT
jgi:hypothetical protein